MGVMGMHAGRPSGPMTRLTNNPLRVPTNDDGAVVVDSDEDPASHAVGHADDGLVEVVLPQPTFELDVQGLARSEEGSKVHLRSIHSYGAMNHRSRMLAITLSIFGARNAPVAPLAPPFTPPGAAAPRAGSG